MIVPVELHRAAKDAGPQAHRLDDVEDLPGARDGRVVLLLEQPRRVVLVHQPEIGHASILRPMTVYDRLGARPVVNCRGVVQRARRRDHRRAGVDGDE